MAFKSAKYVSVFALSFLLPAALYAAPQLDDWAVWRGPNLNGHAAGEQTPPVEWSQDKNVIWKAQVPGKGHASPRLHCAQIEDGVGEPGNRKQTEQPGCNGHRRLRQPDAPHRTPAHRVAGAQRQEDQCADGAGLGVGERTGVAT